MPKYIELCAGLGGMRIGLDRAGWTCVFAADKDEAAVRAHQHGVGQIACADVTEIDPATLPEFEAMAAGFPCQPFSTSGPKLGFRHESGNVFGAIHRIVMQQRPAYLLLENVTGLLTHKKGHTFKVILDALSSIDYHVEWAVIDIAWLGVPQTRPRLFILGTDQTAGAGWRETGLTLVSILHGLGNETPLFSDESIEDEALRPTPVRIPEDAERYEWAENGFSNSQGVSQWRGVDLPAKCGKTLLGKTIAPAFNRPEVIKPVRFYARGKPTYLYTRDIPVGYCLGNIPGGAPLFAVELSQVDNERERENLLQYTNWSRDQDGHVVFRLTPERALHLFGPDIELLEKALTAPNLTLTKKYQLVGNMVAPVVANRIAQAINGSRGRRLGKSSSTPLASP